MGNYLNPGNDSFKTICNDLYVDKSGMIGLLNSTINTPLKLTCVSRPRRFGKSFAAKMLCAYYDKTCDSSSLFRNLKIASDRNYNSSYKKYLNHFDVIYLDMTGIIGDVRGNDLISFIIDNVTDELLSACPGLKTAPGFSATLANAAKLIGNKFFMIIDEWDAPIREYPELQEDYLRFLRSLFKNSSLTDKIFAGAYMTGILPIKKDGSQSAISDFEEYTMVNPRHFAPYVGFTEEEVQKLCELRNANYSLMKVWYDGYSFPKSASVYNPNSVMKALRNEDFDSYWVESSASENLRDYISLDFDGLAKTMSDLLGGVRVKVDTKGFSNDLVSFHNRDDVLTLLIHLGYLAYDAKEKTVRIPNKEIREEFQRSFREAKKVETIQRVRESDRLILDTIHMNEKAVAEQIEKIHEEESPLYYNSEQALRSVIKRAYFSFSDEYIMFEELPAGSGYADVVYLPKQRSLLPVLIIELKWNQSAEGAIAQIKDRNYPEPLKNFGSNILLVGISYSKDAPSGKRKHTCIIEKYEI